MQGGFDPRHARQYRWIDFLEMVSYTRNMQTISDVQNKIVEYVETHVFVPRDELLTVINDDKFNIAQIVDMMVYNSKIKIFKFAINDINHEVFVPNGFTDKRPVKANEYFNMPA